MDSILLACTLSQSGQAVFSRIAGMKVSTKKKVSLSFNLRVDNARTVEGSGGSSLSSSIPKRYNPRTSQAARIESSLLAPNRNTAGKIWETYMHSTPRMRGLLLFIHSIVVCLRYNPAYAGTTASCARLPRCC